MSRGMVQVSRRRPCPICGKPDWCCFWQPDLESELIICKRSSGVTSDVTGQDGKLYKYLGLTKDENAKFQEYDQWETQYEQWLQENHKGKYSDNRPGGYDRWYGATKRKKIIPAAKSCEFEVVDPVERNSRKEMDRFYRSLMSVLVLDNLHYDYLRSEGWSKELISSSGVKSFPAKDIIRFNHEMYKSRNFYRKRITKAVMQKLGVSDLRGYPGAYTDKGGNWTLNGPSGLALPIYDADGYMYGIRIRMDFCDVNRTLEQTDDGLWFYTHEGITYYHQPLKGFYHFDGIEKVYDNFYYDDNGYEMEIKGKYRPMTSYIEDRKERENGRIVNRLTNGCQAENGISVYFNPETDNPRVVYFTEGEKKGIFANAIMKVPVVTFPGVGSWRAIFQGNSGESLVDKLVEYGCKICVIAYDADKETNREVLAQQQNVVNALLAYGFQVGLATWSQKNGKGLDDCLAAGYAPGFELMKNE